MVGERASRQDRRAADGDEPGEVRRRPAGKLSARRQKLSLCCALINDPDLHPRRARRPASTPCRAAAPGDFINTDPRAPAGDEAIVATAYMDEERFDWLDGDGRRGQDYRHGHAEGAGQNGEPNLDEAFTMR